MRLRPGRVDRRLTLLADVVRLGILCAASIFLASGDESDGVRALLVLPASVTARAVRVHPALDSRSSRSRWPPRRSALAVGLHTTYSPVTTQLLTSCCHSLCGPVLYVLLVRVGVLAAARATPTSGRLVTAAIATAAAVVALGVMWELVELGADGGTRYQLLAGLPRHGRRSAQQLHRRHRERASRSACGFASPPAGRSLQLAPLTGLTQTTCRMLRADWGVSPLLGSKGHR